MVIVKKIKQKFYYVYEIRNLLMGWLYRGRRTSDVPFEEDFGYMGSSKILDEDILFFGVENFEKTLIEYCADGKHLGEREAFYADIVWAKRDDTYNLVAANQNLYVSYDGVYIFNTALNKCRKIKKSFLNSYLERGWEQGRRFKLNGVLFLPFTKEWNNNFDLLKSYVKLNNKIPFISNKLGRWCNSQRANYKSGELAQERIVLLESIELWSWTPLQEQWNEKFELLKKYIQQKNKLPGEFTTIEGVKIGKWCGSQRLDYKNNNLPKQQIDLLENIKIWTWNKENSQWNRIFDLLKEYVVINGKLPTWGVMFKDEQLGVWCQHQRGAYKHNRLSNERVLLFDNIPNWSWTTIEEIHEKRWNNSFNLVREYVKINDKLPAKSVLAEGHSLGLWCITQRREYKKNNISKERIFLLESISIWKWEIEKYFVTLYKK